MTPAIIMLTTTFASFFALGRKHLDWVDSITAILIANILIANSDYFLPKTMQLQELDHESLTQFPHQYGVCLVQRLTLGFLLFASSVLLVYTFLILQAFLHVVMLFWIG